MSKHKDINGRRGFLTLLARGGVLASLGLLAGALGNREHDGSGCRNDFVCGSCRKSSDCRLPEADAFRLEKARKPKTGNHG
jgi:hypothetical protein